MWLARLIDVARGPALWAVLAVGGCSSSPSDLREWTPADHQHTDGPSQGQVNAQPTAAPPPGLDEVTIVAWRRSCMRCHGVVGRGDGPEGRMVAATDLSEPAWQERTSDEQIALTIRQGKGAMPPFDLPDGTIQGLVKLVRLFHADRQANPNAGAPEAPGQPPASADSPAAPSPSGAQSPPSPQTAPQ